MEMQTSTLVGPRVDNTGAQTLYNQIARNCARFAKATALSHGGKRITYGALGQQAAHIRDMLSEAGVCRGQIVPVVTCGGPGMIAAMIGIWAAGGAFAPLAADGPKARLDGALDRLAAPAVLVDGPCDRIDGYRCLLISDATDKARTASTGPLDEHAPLSQQDLAYGFFTSGSTGIPKCCLNVHGGLVNRAAAMSRRFELSRGEAVLQNSSHVFDSSLWQIFWPLSVGAEVVIPDRRNILDLRGTLREIAAHNVVMTDFVPSIFEQFLALLRNDSAARDKLDSMRYLLVGGEALSLRLLQDFTAAFPAIRLVNTYGPTEASIGMVFHVFNGRETRIPLGTPIDNTALTVVGSDLQPLPRGERGEIVIGGACMGLGYLGEPVRTARAFLKDTGLPLGSDVVYRTGDMGHVGEDGLLYFDGRCDDQVKINGVRIEVGEIEHHLRAVAGIRRAKVVPVPSDDSVWLAGFYISDRELCPQSIKAEIEAAVGPTGVPSALRRLERFPTTASGKIDSRALITEHCRHVPVEQSSDDSQQAQLLAFCGKLLPGRRLGPCDDLIAAGLDSLGALTLALEVERITGVPMSLERLAAAPSISAICSGYRDDHAVSTAEIKRDVEETVAFEFPAPSLLVTERRRAVLLTGATGYVGRHVLEALLRRTECDIHCVSRDQNRLMARGRILSALPIDLMAEAARVRIVLADLEHGAADVSCPAALSCVIHAAADVNFSKGYRQLRAANVRSVARLCAFADAADARFIQISSAAVLANGAVRPEASGNRLPALAGDAVIPRTGYGQSKWAAEHVTEAYRCRGLNADIFRLGEMMPDPSAPTVNSRSAFAILCRAAHLVGLTPDLDEMIDYTPMGPVAALIAERGTAVYPVRSGQTVNLINPTPVSVSNMFRAVLGPAQPIGVGAFVGALERRHAETREPDLMRAVLLLRPLVNNPGIRLFHEPEFF